MALVVAVSLVGAEVFFDRALESSIRRSIYAGVEGVSSAVGDSIARFLQDNSTDAQAIGLNIPLEALMQRRVAVVERYLAKMLKIYPKFQNGMFILDAQGYLWVDYPRHPETRGRRFNFREYFKRTMAEGQGIVGTPYRSARTGEPVLTFTALLKSPRGEILGLLGCSVQLLSPYALGGIRKEKIGRSGYVYVYDKTRLMILHPNDRRVLKRDVSPGANKLFDAALAGWQGVGETLNSRGVAMLLSLKAIPGTNWIVGAQQPKEEAFAPLVSIRLRLLLGTCLGVFIAVLLAIFVIRRITNPLQRLRQATLNLGEKGVEQKLAGISSDDEIGDLAATYIDISRKLRRSMDSMQKTSREWQRTFDSVQDAICLLDTGRRIMRLNRAAARLLQVKEEPPAEKTIEQLLAELDWRAEGSPHQDAGQPLGILGNEVIITNGESYLELVNTPLGDEPGAAGGFIFIARDISGRRHSEQEKDQLQAQLQQAQKMEAVGILASGIAHDFNNILQTISGYTQLISSPQTPAENRTASLEQVNRAVERAAALVRQLLTFGRKVEPELKPVDLNQEVNQALDVLERTLPKMIRMERNLAPDLHLIDGDPNQLEQVLLNLGANARDSMPDGGQLTFATANFRLDQAQSKQHLDLAPGDYVHLRVSDTGQGMDAETLEHIFDPFFTTKEVGEGSGLGLSTVYGIVRGHGGHIACQSVPQGGTSFDIYLPARPASQQVPGAYVPPPEKMDLRGSETLLLVDDEATILGTGSQMLAEYGYKVLTADSGERALEIYRQQVQEIDAVILDLGMPGIGGYSCLLELIALDPRAQVLVASGYGAQKQAVQVLEAGAADFIRKPYQFAELLRRLRRLLDGVGEDSNRG